MTVTVRFDPPVVLEPGWQLVAFTDPRKDCPVEHDQARVADDPRADIARRFTNHPPVTNRTSDALDGVTLAMIEVGNFIVDTVPAGREQALALTQLEQCSMWCKAGIARNQPDARESIG